MKTLIIVCLTMFLVFGFSGLVMAEEIPGGIVFCDGREIIYQDFQTSQKISLTGDLTGPTIKGPVAISEDGTVLIWFFNGKFYFRQIPYGMPFVAPATKSNKSEPILLPENIRNITLSPQGNQYAYEFLATEKAFVQAEPGRPGAKDVFRYPMYVEKMDTYNAVAVFNVRDGRLGEVDLLGNVAENPPTLPVRIIPPPIPGVPKAIVAWMEKPNIKHLDRVWLLEKDSWERFSVKREARFLAWEKTQNWKPNDQKIAFIYQTSRGWGPIEIRDVNENRNIRDLNRIREAGVKNVKPGVWEIPVLLKTCEGLAWKPDGSLTYLTEGKVFSVDGAKIKAGIEKSGIAPDSKRSVDFNPVANIFNIESTLVAQGIQGDSPHWISNDTLLFRGKDNNLYRQRQGAVEKILSEVPQEFSYCDVPPLSFLAVASGTRKLGDELFFTNNTYEYFVGNAKVHWVQAVGVMDPPFWINNQEGLEFVFPAEKKIEDIKDPAGYEYKKVSSVTTGGFKLQVAPGQIVLLKLDGKITAIKVIDFERKYKSVAEMPKSLQSSWKEMEGRLPFWGWAPIEWKHWRTLPSTDTALVKETPKPVEAENKLANMDNTGKAEVKGRLMSRSNTYNPRTEFDIVIGNVKTIGSVQKKERLETNKSVSRSLALTILTNPLPGCRYVILPSDTNLEVVSNPGIYQYKSDNVACMLYPVQMKQIIVLSFPDGKYAAIMPIEIRQDPDGLSLIYEWKYWPTATVQTVAGVKSQ